MRVNGRVWDMRVYVVLQLTKVKKTKTLDTFEFSLHIRIHGLLQDYMYSNFSALLQACAKPSFCIHQSHGIIMHLHCVSICRVNSYEIRCRIFYFKPYLLLNIIFMYGEVLMWCDIMYQIWFQIYINILMLLTHWSLCYWDVRYCTSNQVLHNQVSALFSICE